MLDQIKIASPCSSDWERMEGTDRVRFCGECKKNVFNLSAMTRRDAEALLRETNGNLCTQIYRRTDGIVLTADCPVGFGAKASRLNRRVSWAVAGALGFAAAAFGQSPAILSGKVTDATGAPVTETTITVTDPKTVKSIELKTDAEGKFRIASLEPGSYTLSAQRAGFQQFKDNHVQLPISGEIKMSIQLAVGTAGGPIFIETASAAPPVTPMKPKPWWRRLL